MHPRHTHEYKYTYVVKNILYMLKKHKYKGTIIQWNRTKRRTRKLENWERKRLKKKYLTSVFSQIIPFNYTRKEISFFLCKLSCAHIYVCGSENDSFADPGPFSFSHYDELLITHKSFKRNYTRTHFLSYTYIKDLFVFSIQSSTKLGQPKIDFRFKISVH